MQLSVLCIDMYFLIKIQFQTTAHEIGHLLGVQHDFEDIGTLEDGTVVKTERFCSDGTLCTDDNGIMDYYVVSSLQFTMG